MSEANLNTDISQKTLRVANVTNVQNLATAIAKNIEERHNVVLACIGVQAVNQAVKSVAIANSKMAPLGKILYICPAFRHVQLDPQEGSSGKSEVRTVIDLNLIHRSLGA